MNSATLGSELSGRLEIHFYSLLWAILQNFLSFLWSVGGQLETSDRKFWVHAACTKQLTRPDYIGMIGTIHQIPNTMFLVWEILGVCFTSARRNSKMLLQIDPNHHKLWPNSFPIGSCWAARLAAASRSLPSETTEGSSRNAGVTAEWGFVTVCVERS